MNEHTTRLTQEEVENYERWIKGAGPHSIQGKFYRRVLSEKGPAKEAETSPEKQITVEQLNERPEPLTYNLRYNLAATAEILASKPSAVTRALLDLASQNKNIPPTAKFVFGLAGGAKAEDYCEVIDEDGKVLARYLVHENESKEKE